MSPASEKPKRVLYAPPLAILFGYFARQRITDSAPDAVVIRNKAGKEFFKEIREYKFFLVLFTAVVVMVISSLCAAIACVAAVLVYNRTGTHDGRLVHQI
jgi:hypothetical protein